MEVAPAHTVIAALSRTRTSLDGTMTPVPASHTQAGAILTLAMPLTSEEIGAKLTHDIYLSYFSPHIFFYYIIVNVHCIFHSVIFPTL